MHETPNPYFGCWVSRSRHVICLWFRGSHWSSCQTGRTSLCFCCLVEHCVSCFQQECFATPWFQHAMRWYACFCLPVPFRTCVLPPRVPVVYFQVLIRVPSSLNWFIKVVSLTLATFELVFRFPCWYFWDLMSTFQHPFGICHCSFSVHLLHWCVLQPLWSTWGCED